MPVDFNLAQSREQHVEAAVAAYQHGELGAAAQSFATALDFDTFDVDVLVQLGVVRYQMGEFAPAIVAFRRALEVDPLVVDALYGLGAALFQLGRYQAAETFFQRVLELAPEHAEAAESLAEAGHMVQGSGDDSGSETSLVALAAADAKPSGARFGKRSPTIHHVKSLEQGLSMARTAFEIGNYLEAFDLFEQLLEMAPHYDEIILEQAYYCYLALPEKDSRYLLYQARHFDFGIAPGDKVLDVGSGHMPFPFATHLGEFAIHDDSFGRAGIPFKQLNGRPVFECNVESLPFADQEFDFVYCSHVLEHVSDPARACRELMRVAKRGYIETPTRGKDLWMHTAQQSNHRWSVELHHGVLTFTEYTPSDLKGLESDLLLRMHCHPETRRERALSALLYLKSDMLNTMLLWDGQFAFDVRPLRP